MNKVIFLLLVIVVIFSCQKHQKEDILYKSESFSIFKDKVIQGSNKAEVLSSTHIISNYKSPASARFSRLVKFKFSINEKDNELPIGVDHWVIIGDHEKESSIVKFGQQPAPTPNNPDSFLPSNYQYTFKVDMSSVLNQFETKGYYEAFDGTRVAQSDFKGFYIAGNAEPLSWDFVNLGNKGLQLQPTEDPNIYEITLMFNPYDITQTTDKEWKPTKDISHKPKYTSHQPIVDALFNLSLEEAIKNIEPDSTLRTGAKWDGVWTRDVSYSILLAFAYHEPEVAKISLRKKIKRGRIVQDTGSGGAWPVSSDRTTWCLAAWEIYKVTGDDAWLDEVYPIIKNTLDDDYLTLYDGQTGMFSGESSFLDWREQTYPKWMDNKDIYVSQNLGTNVVHYQAHRILGEMAKIKGESSEKYFERAAMIKKGINDHLWMPEKGYYGNYLYGRDFKTLSPRFEALGEALAILFDVADDNKATEIISKSPLTEYGATCIYPQIPGIPPYHNDAIWPFVQSYWNWAAAKNGNEAVLNHGLASIYRAASLFLTNYENMVASSGDFEGTEINSDRMLWSMAGNMAMVHRIFIGMDFKLDGLYFNPVVPKIFGGEKSLTHFNYRNASLNITVKGHGTIIKNVTINGQSADKAFIPVDAIGTHDIIITLANNDFPNTAINSVPNHYSLPTVIAKRQGNQLLWQSINDVKEYNVYRNGKPLDKTVETYFNVKDEQYATYAISAVDSKGYEGFLSEPVVFAKEMKIFQAEDFEVASTLPYTNYNGSGFIALTMNQNREVFFRVMVEEAGTYLVDFRYANGSGPWNTDNKCAIRSLSINDTRNGVIVMPQRGNNEWSDWGFSNAHTVVLNEGMNEIKLYFEDNNHNMNVDVNTAMIDFLRLIKK